PISRRRTVNIRSAYTLKSTCRSRTTIAGPVPVRLGLGNVAPSMAIAGLPPSEPHRAEDEQCNGPDQRGDRLGAGGRHVKYRPPVQGEEVEQRVGDEHPAQCVSLEVGVDVEQHSRAVEEQPKQEWQDVLDVAQGVVG